MMMMMSSPRVYPTQIRFFPLFFFPDTKLSGLPLHKRRKWTMMGDDDDDDDGVNG